MLGEIVWRGFSLLYGFVSWIAMVARAVIREGAFTKKMDEEEKRQLAAGTADLSWSSIQLLGRLQRLTLRSSEEILEPRPRTVPRLHAQVLQA